MTDSHSDFIIAVVDDDHGILESLESLLLSANYAVRMFTSADALLESEGLAEVDFLISDINMPVMDGFALLRSIRAQSPDLPVILITGHPDFINRLPLVGHDQYRLFKKPFDGEDLLAAISDALSGRSPRISKS